MGKITPITISTLQSWNIKFISVNVPAFPIKIKKTCRTKRHFFKTLADGKAFLDGLRATSSPIIVYDVEKTQKGQGCRDSKFVQTDCFYLQLAEIDKVDFTIVYENIKKKQYINFNCEWDLSNFK